MSTKFHLRSFALSIVLGAVVLFSVAATSGKRTEWEYTTYFQSGSHPNLESINKLGAGGWELVGSFNSSDGKYPGFMFKRPRR